MTLSVDDVQALIDATPAGGTVNLSGGCTIAATLTIDKPLTITGDGALTYTSTTGPLFRVTSSDVTLRDLRLVGPGIDATDRVPGNHAVWATGSLAAPLSGLRVHGCDISGFADSGMWVEYATRAHLDGNTVRDVLYAGIMGVTLTDSTIGGNVVSNVVQKGATVNTYGIAVTDMLNTVAARSSNVAITGNVVEFVRDWEGIDTHGGLNIAITGNAVTGCRDGICCVAGNPTRAISPENVVVTGNTIDSTGSNAPRAGARLYGVSATTPASGVVVGNTIRGAWGISPVQVANFDPDLTQCDRYMPWSPTWTGLTIGNGTQVARYTRVGDSVVASLSVTLGTTSVVTKLFDFTVPAPFGAGVATYQGVGSATLVDTSAGSAGRYAATALVLSLSGRVMFTVDNKQATNTSPFAWTAGDKIAATITYETS